MFKSLVIIETTGTEEFISKQLSKFGEEVTYYKETSKSEEETISRLKDADAVLLSWNCKLTEKVIDSCPNLKYIGLCCSYFSDESSNVAVTYARKKGITVTDVKDYGDDGVVEFVISSLIQATKGYKSLALENDQLELKSLKVGIIGLGTLGNMIGEALNFFKTEVKYHNRKQREDVSFEYISTKEELIKQSDVIITSLPRNTMVLNSAELSKWNQKIYINVGIGLPIIEKDLLKWSENRKNLIFIDQLSASPSFKKQVENRENVTVFEKTSGFTKNARERLSKNVIQNIEEYNNGVLSRT